MRGFPYIPSLLALALVPAQAQHTIHIPADQPTIQSAIDAAQPGDTLLVAPGAYTENLDLHGKAITLQSAEGPTVTILDGSAKGPTVSFTTAETRATTLSGFTIRNGAPAAPTPALPEPHGAGILLANASPTLTNNILTGNLCAAIDATSSAPLLQNNTITHTTVSAACTAQAVAPIVFTGSAATLRPTLLHNTVESNDLTGSAIQPNAGAIALLAAPVTLQGNILRNNTVPGDAPAAIQILANPTATGSTPILLQQNLIVANRTHCGPAGLSVTILNTPATTPHLELQILNNTIADNLTDTTCPNTQPSEVELTPGTLAPQVLLANNILATSANATTLLCSTPLPPAMFHHNLLSNPQGLTLAPTCPDSGANLQTDPQFTARAQADYHLNLTSPAVDAGSNAAGPLPQQDLDASPRLENATGQPTAIVDFGAYEHPAPKASPAATTTILNATISPSEAFQTVTLSTAVTTTQSGTTPTGTVTLTASSPTVAPVTLAVMPLDANAHAAYTTSTLPTGPWTLLAAYTGSDTLAPSTSAPMLQTVNPATTVLGFSLTPSNAALGQTVTATALLTAPLSTRIPTGAVQFYELTTPTPTLLGPAALDAKGRATFTLPAMSTGTHRILAAYPGAADFAPATLPTADALTLTIGSSDFAATLSASTMTLVAQHHGPLTVTLKSLGSFADTVTLSCANLPANTSCSFAPTAAALTAGSSSAVVVTVDTSVIPGFASLTRLPSTTTLATLLPLGLLALLRRRRSTLLLAAALLTGCGAGKYPDHTAPGTYQINIVATAKTTGVAHTTPMTLVVTE